MESYSVEAVLSAVDRGFTKTLGVAEGSLQSFGNVSNKMSSSYTKAVSTAMKVGTAAISAATAAFGKYAISSAADLRVVDAQYSQTFKGIEKQADATVKEMGKTWNMLPNRVKPPLSQFASYFRGTGKDVSEALDTSKTAMQIAADASAYYDKSIEDTSASLKGFLMGNYENGDAIGINTNLTKIGAAYNDKYGASFDDLSEAAKADYLLEYINDVYKLNGVIGQASRESHEWENVMGNLKGSVKDLAGAVGEPFMDKLIAGAEKATQTLTSVANAIPQLVAEFNSLDSVGAKIEFIKNTLEPIIPLLSVIGTAGGLAGALPIVSKLSDGFTSIASKGKGAADSIGSIASKAKGLGKSFNLQSISGKFDSVFSSSLTKATTFTHDLGKTFSTLAPSTTEFFMDLESKVPSVFGKVAKSANTVSAPVNKVREAMKNFGDNMPLVSKGVSNLSTGITSGLSTAASTGTTVLSGFMSSITSVVGIALKMIAPAAIIGVVLAGLGVAMTQFGDEINAFINEMAVKGPEVITNFADGIISQLPNLIALGAEMVTNLLNAIAANIPTILSKGTELITTLIQGVSNALPQMIPAALNVVTALLNGIISNAPKLLMAGMNLLLSLVNGIVQNLPLIMQSAQSVIMNFVTMVVSYLPQIITIGFQILMSLVNGIMQMLPALIPVAVQAIVTLINGLVSMLPMIIQMALTLVQTLLEGLVANLPMILQGGLQIIQALIQGLITALPQIITMGIQIIFMLVSSIIQMLPTILTAGWEIIKSLASGILEAIPNVLQGAWDGIKSGFSSLWDTITGKSKETGDTASTNIQSATTNMQTSVDTLSASASSSMAGMSSNVSGITSGLTSDVTGQFGTMASQGGSYASSLEGSVTSATDSLSSLGSIDIAALQSNAEGSFSAMNATGSSLVEDLSANVSSSANDASSDATKNYEQMAQGVNQAMSKINTDTTSAFNKANATVKKATATMTSSIKSATNNMQSAVRAGMSAINSAIASGMSSAVAIVSSRASSIVAVFRGLQGAMHSSGVYAMSGLAGGINAGAGSAIAAANSVANQVASTINKALKIHSPSRVTEESGEFTTEGLEVGMLNRLRNLKRTAVKVASVVSDNLATGVAFDAEVALAGNYAGVNLARTLNRTSNNQMTAKQPILVEVNQAVDGRQFMKSTYKYYVEEDGRRTRLAKRAKGETH